MQSNSATIAQRIIGFTLSDLQANRAGVMTERQQAALDSRRRQRILEFGSVLGATLGLLAFMGISLALSGEGSVVAAVTFIGGVFAGTAAQNKVWGLWRSVGSDVEAAKVHMIFGRVYVETTRLRSVEIHHLVVTAHHNRSKRFEIDEDAAHLFQANEGEHYRVYYTPQAQIVLSAEAC